MLSTLESILREVGSRLLEWRERGATQGTWAGTQFKAEADKMAHEALLARLQQHWPQIAVVSEEEEAGPHSLPRYWLIDPIDGTASYAQGFPGFVTQAALVEVGKPQLAAVYAPALGLMYSARRGEGACLNAKTLPPAACGIIPQTLIDNYPAPRGVARAAFEAFSCKHYVECGSIGLKICKVADGTADLFVKDVPVRDWDLAAPQLVLEETGGALRDVHGAELTYWGMGRHDGLIAAHDQTLCARVAQWYASLPHEESAR